MRRLGEDDTPLYTDPTLESDGDVMREPEGVRSKTGRRSPSGKQHARLEVHTVTSLGMVHADNLIGDNVHVPEDNRRLRKQHRKLVELLEVHGAQESRLLPSSHQPHLEKNPRQAYFTLSKQIEGEDIFQSTSTGEKHVVGIRVNGRSDEERRKAHE